MLVKADAVFESALGITVLLAAATHALGGSDFPRPVGTALLLVVGAALVVLGGAIWAGGVGLKPLALGNGLSALAGVAWLAAVSGFSAAGAASVGLTVAGLAVLAAAQAATLRA
jgi:hypothetical protein